MALVQTRWPLRIQMLCGAFLIFIGGMMVAVYHWFPDSQLRPTFLRLRTMFQTDARHAPIRYRGVEGVTARDPARMARGVTFITSHWKDPRTGTWSPGLRVIDSTGKTLHHWTIKPTEIWPQHLYADPFRDPDPFSDIHGAYLFPNGDVLFNLEFIGVQRVDACGKLIWKLQHRVHHSVAPDDDGTFWVSAGKRFESVDAQRRKYPALSPPFLEESALHVSADGKDLGEVDLLDALFTSGYGELMTRGYGDWLRFRRIMPRDAEQELTHMNDVEPLSAALATKFPMFAAGDLLVSMREISAVFVTDRKGHIKWLDASHFLRQHDPDFEADGTIVVLDNRSDNTDAGIGSLHGSRIAAIDPSTQIVRTLYPAGGALDATPRFYTGYAGTHQLLANGNRLIAETRAGRALEVTPAGEIVWQWIQTPHDQDTVPEIMEATRYDFDPSVVTAWPCPPPPP